MRVSRTGLQGVMEIDDQPVMESLAQGEGGGLHTADPHCDTLFYRSLRPVSMNEWHWVRVSRTGLQGVMEIDDQPPVEGLAQGAFTQLTLTQDLFIGGHYSFDETSSVANLSSSFYGCIQKVSFTQKALRLFSIIFDYIISFFFKENHYIFCI